MNLWKLLFAVKSGERKLPKRSRRRVGLAIEILEDRLSPAVITSRATGNWGSQSTWEGNQVPSEADDVIIAQGNFVTVNAQSLFVNT